MTHITDEGVFCYKIMSFSLKKAGATYQRLISKIFRNLVGKTVEVDLDDMMIKTKTLSKHARDMVEAFNILKKVGIKLNLE